jgi:hypothetical protein
MLQTLPYKQDIIHIQLLGFMQHSEDVVVEASANGTSIWRLDSNSTHSLSTAIEITGANSMPCEVANANAKDCFLMDHHEKRSHSEGMTRAAIREAMESRSCNSCASTKTTKWYKDHNDFGKHICKKCYNHRYKERIRC